MCFKDSWGQCHYDGQFNCRDACGVDELYKRIMMASSLQACSLAARFSGIGASVPNRHAGITQAGPCPLGFNWIGTLPAVEKIFHSSSLDVA